MGWEREERVGKKERKKGKKERNKYILQAVTACNVYL
jgi:hypothetical protein